MARFEALKAHKPNTQGLLLPKAGLSAEVQGHCQIWKGQFQNFGLEMLQIVSWPIGELEGKVEPKLAPKHRKAAHIIDFYGQFDRAGSYRQLSSLEEHHLTAREQFAEAFER